MKLLKFTKRTDYGTDLYLQVLFTKRWALFQGCVSWGDASWPYLQISMGMGKLISVIFWAHKFGIDFGFLERTWNLERLDMIEVDKDG
jgi:hypothetical protein